MPNHVTTRCVVTGPADAVTAFRERAIRKHRGDSPDYPVCLDFEAYIPMPEVLWGTVEDGGYNPDTVPAREAAFKATGFHSWYPWSIEKWGTKWNAYSFIVVREEPGLFEFKFDTAWSFPEPAFEKITEEHPDLEFEWWFFDEGWNFAGSGYAGDGDFHCDTRDADDETYEMVYGHAPERNDEGTPGAAVREEDA